MGRTDEAVQVLETLARTFPGQAKLLAEAKKRLEEWTAVDLKQSFADWYQRYQYSPEFQAKIVDLVLKLGVSDNKVRYAAENELTTIGKPALPALREHVYSNNHTLQDNAAALIFLLGAVPPAEALADRWRWTRHGQSWARLLEAGRDPEQRASLLAGLAGKEDLPSRAARAAVEGPSALLDLFEKESTAMRSMASTVLWRLPDVRTSPALRTRLLALVRNDALSEEVRAAAAQVLTHRMIEGERTEEDVALLGDEILAWLRSDMHALRHLAQSVLANGPVRGPDDWKAIAAVLEDAARTGKPEAGLYRAFRATVAAAPADADLDEALRAVDQALRVSAMSSLFDAKYAPLSANARRLLRRVLTESLAPRAPTAVKTWVQAFEESADLPKDLVAFAAASGQTGVVRACIREAGERVRNEAVLDGLLALLGPERTRRRHADDLLRGLARNPGLMALPWTEGRLAGLVQGAAVQTEAAGSRAMRTLHLDGAAGKVSVTTHWDIGTSQVFYRLFEQPPTRALLLRVAARDPAAFPARLWQLLGHGWTDVKAHRDEVWSAMAEAWPTWVEKGQVVAGLDLFVRELLRSMDRETWAFLRPRLETLRKASDEARDAVVELLDLLTLEDLQRLFDLSTDAGVDEAAGWAAAMVRNDATYEALVRAMRPGGPKAAFFGDAFAKKLPARRADIIARLLANGRDDAADGAYVLLQQKRDPAEFPLWLKALDSKHAFTRQRVATVLGRFYDKRVIKALAGHVDDPDPNVRDAVLKALETIKDTEEKKDYWRKFAEEKSGD